jgi:hypothetical protein
VIIVERARSVASKVAPAIVIMNIKLQGFYVYEGALITTVVEFKINIKQEDYPHQQTGHKCNEESCEMLHLEHRIYGAEIWTLRRVDQKYLGNFEVRCWRRLEKTIRSDRVRNEEGLL